MTTVLACTPEKVWQELRRPRLFRYVCKPLVTFEPVQPAQLPEEWEPCEFLVRMYLFGQVPLGKQWIRPSLEAPRSTAGRTTYEMHDNGSSGLCKRFDHYLTAEETVDGQTRYTDRVEIQAGLLTPLVWLLARTLFHWRQRRWRRLVRNGFDYSQ
jgi:hypothetical protein